MRKLTYVSADFFFDVDFPVLKNISKYYSITWYAIVPNQNSRYSVEYLKLFCRENNISLKVKTRVYRRRHIKSFLFINKIISEINKGKGDIIYIEDTYDIYMSILCFIRLKKNNVIIALHDIIQHKGISSKFIISFAQKILIAKFYNFHLFSESQSKVFNKKDKKVLVAPLMLKDFGLSTISETNTENVKLLFFGRIEYYKGLDILIKAINILQQEGVTNFELTIAGNSHNWNFYEEIIKNVSNFNLIIRFIDNKEIANLFKSHHYLILPYRDVTQSGPLFIAYNYEIPVIAADFDGFREFITHSYSGYLFKKTSVKSLADTMQEVIKSHDVNYNLIKSNLKSEIELNFKDEIIISKYLNFFRGIGSNLR